MTRPEVRHLARQQARRHLRREMRRLVRVMRQRKSHRAMRDIIAEVFR